MRPFRRVNPGILVARRPPEFSRGLQPTVLGEHPAVARYLPCPPTPRPGRINKFKFDLKETTPKGIKGQYFSADKSGGQLDVPFSIAGTDSLRI